jgi:hypothetical protein
MVDIGDENILQKENLKISYHFSSVNANADGGWKQTGAFFYHFLSPPYLGQ